LPLFAVIFDFAKVRKFPHQKEITVGIAKKNRDSDGDRFYAKKLKTSIIRS